MQKLRQKHPAAMSMSKSKFGAFNLYTIETGDFKLDGGAMFGVVPKLYGREASKPMKRIVSP